MDKNKHCNNKLVNASLILIEEQLDNEDTLFLELYALSLYIKFKQCDSKIRFHSERDLLRQLQIGHNKWVQFKKHPKFNDLFRLTDEFLVAKKYRVNGRQLTLGYGNKPLSERLIVKIHKNKNLTYKEVYDKLLEAMFVNKVKILDLGMYGSEPCSGSETNSDKDGEVSKSPFAGIIDSTLSNDTVAAYLHVGTTKAKKIINMAVKDHLVKKMENVRPVAYVNDPYAYIEAHEEEHHIGKLIPSHKEVLWQIPNSYTLVNRKAKNKSYYGYISVKRTKPNESKQGPMRKYDDGFFNKNNKKELKFLKASYMVTFDGEILGIMPNDKKEENIRLRATDGAMRSYKDLWPAMSSRQKNRVIKQFENAIKADEKKEKLDKFLKHLKKYHDKVAEWDEPTTSKAKEELSLARKEAQKAGTSVEAIYGRIKRRMISYNENHKENVSFVQMRDIYAKEAGDLQNAVMALTQDAIAMHRKEEFESWQKKLDRQNDFKNNTDFEVSQEPQTGVPNIPEDKPVEANVTKQDPYRNINFNLDTFPFWDDEEDEDPNTFSSFVLPDVIPNASTTFIPKTVEEQNGSVSPITYNSNHSNPDSTNNSSNNSEDNKRLPYTIMEDEIIEEGEDYDPYYDLDPDLGIYNFSGYPYQDSVFLRSLDNSSNRSKSVEDPSALAFREEHPSPKRGAIPCGRDWRSCYEG